MLLVCSMFGQMQAQEINPEVEKGVRTSPCGMKDR